MTWNTRHVSIINYLLEDQELRWHETQGQAGHSSRAYTEGN